MRKSTPFVAVYSFIAILLIAGAVGYFLYNMQVELSVADSRAKKTFAALVTRLQRFEGDNVAYVIGNLNDYSSIYIKKGERALYSYPNTLAKDARSSKFIKVYNTTYQKQNDATPYTVTAALYTLRPAAIFKYAKISFIAVMAVTIITIVILICRPGSEEAEADEDEVEAPVMDLVNLHATSKKDAKAPLAQNAKPDSADKANNPDKARSADKDNNSDKARSAENLDSLYNFGNTDEADKDNNLENSTSKKTSGSPTDDAKAPAEKTKSQQPSREALDHIIDNEEKDSVLKMYSEETGVLLKSQLEKRLGSIISKCAATDEDLCLFSLRVQGVDEIVAFASDCAKLLIGEVMFRDRVFDCADKYEKVSFAFIKEAMAINAAVDYCRALIKKIKRLPGGALAKVLIGVTSRAGRLVETATLTTEVHECLRRCENDKEKTEGEQVGRNESKIVSFHVDLGKYRETLTSDGE